MSQSLQLCSNETEESSKYYDYSPSLAKLYITETEASHRYGPSRQWFQRERWKGTGPKFIKVNGSGKILYPIEETDGWFAGFGLQQSTSKI